MYLFTWLIQVLAAALGIFDLRYGVWDLVPWPQIKPGPCIGSMESQSLGHQESHCPDFSDSVGL